MYNKELDDYINQFRAAIANEVFFLRGEGGKKYRIFNGKCIYSNSPDFVYIFETDLELYLPDSSPVRLEFNNKNYSGDILSCEGFEISIIISEDIGNNIRTAEFSCEPWRLLEELNTRLEESLTIPEFNRDIAYNLICEGRNMSIYTQRNLKKGQDAAIKDSLSKPISIIWGPPGTGKTHTLANIAIEHYLKGNKVLIVSHSNIAVDGAILKIFELLKARREQLFQNNKVIVRKGDLLRYGYARSKELNHLPYLTSFNLTMKNFPELDRRKTELEEEKARLKKKGINNSRIFEIEKELRDIRQQIRSHESSLVEDARIVATTISKASVDTAVYKKSSFDVVLLDEASMAYIPQAYFVAGLAKKHFICFGDFRQLSPIAQSDKPMVEKWLLKDIYDHLNITDNVGGGNYHPWLVLLNEQRRMHTKISGFVNSRVYNMSLCDHPDIGKKQKHIIDKSPFRGQAVAMLDLSGTCNVCSKSSDKSRYNLLSAFVSFFTGMIALQEEHKNVGIITPYAAQSRLIRSMIIDYFSENIGQNKLSCATVHQFQGSEKDVIIFDCVDSYRQAKPGVLLTGHKNNNSLRLINVAVTRARGKFITVANRGYWNNKLPLNNSLLRYLLDYLKEKGEHCFGSDLINYCCTNILKSERMKWYNGMDSMPLLRTDISKAKTEILMDVPEGTVVNEDEFSLVLEMAKKRGVKILIRAEKPRKLGQRLSRLCCEHSFAWSPITVIDRHITWYGIPIINTAFISEGDKLPIRHWPVIRFEGVKTADTIISMLEMYRVRDDKTKNTSLIAKGFASFIENCNIKCNFCGSKMVVRKNKSYFLACSAYPNCKNTSLIDKSLVDAYIMQNGIKCKEDGYPLIAAISKYGVFARCKNPLNSHCLDLGEI